MQSEPFIIRQANRREQALKAESCHRGIYLGTMKMSARRLIWPGLTLQKPARLLLRGRGVQLGVGNDPLEARIGTNPFQVGVGSNAEGLGGR